MFEDLTMITLRTLAATGLMLVALAACGGGSATQKPATSAPAAASGAPLASAGAPASAAAATNATPITVKDFTLDPKDVTVKGVVSLAVTNAGPTIHNISIRDASGTVVAATKDLGSGQSEVLSVDIPAGSYVLFCSLPGHESLGIKGTLTVTK